MSSMTIDQLKKSLTEQGITLPPSRSKKADYIKLYNQYSSINDSLGDVYASDDENPPRTGSQSVSSSTSPGKSDTIIKEVENLSDDELFQKLKEFDSNIGPILKNTRRVYEKKLIKLLSTGKKTNSFENKSNADHYGPRPTADEFSDSDIEIISKSPKKLEISNKKSSEPRDSPKPSLPESSKLEAEKLFSSNYTIKNRSSTPSNCNEIKTSRYSYIETIPKGSSYGFIEHTPDMGVSNDIRQRYLDKFNTDKYGVAFNGAENYNISRSGGGEDIFKQYNKVEEPFKPSLGNKYLFGKERDDQLKSLYNVSESYKQSVGFKNKNKADDLGEDSYIGTWEPNIQRYLNVKPGMPKKIPVTSKLNSSSGWFKKFLAALLLLLILFFIIYIYQQWLATDPYKTIEADAEIAIQQSEDEFNAY